MKTASEPGNHLVFLSQAATTESDHRIAKLAEWMGVAVRKIAVESDGRAVLAALRQPGVASPRVAVQALTLAILAKLCPGELREFIQQDCTALLVVGCEKVSDDETLRWLTGGEWRGNGAATDAPAIQLPKGSVAFGKQFSGLKLPTRQRAGLPTFDLTESRSPDTQEIMVADGRPAFFRTLRGSCEVFLLAASDAADIDENLSQDHGIEEHYGQLIPFLIFIRHCFGDASWHSPASTARLIIDDPLLTQSYGFLDYRSLLDSMGSVRYGTSIAFIPWNHWRTSRKQATGLFEHGSALSICVHGCDHTNKEFGTVDGDALHWKAGTAMRRMERHETRTGVPFDRVMVFPQGWFSTPALAALRGNNYLAAVNTTCFPVDGGTEALTIRHFLRPAIVRFHGFPVFQRRYPRHLIDSAFDMFVGRPALLVEHHQYFEQGCRQLEEFVRGLHEVEPELEWTTLSNQLTRSCVTRTVSESTEEVQFFTNRFRLKSQRQDSAVFRLAKFESDPSTVSAVFVNGKESPFSFKGDDLTFEVEADPGQLLDVEVRDDPKPVRTTVRGPGLMHRVGVPVRRVLSEFRDNTLTRHPRILEAATGVARAMKTTADHDREERVG